MFRKPAILLLLASFLLTLPAHHCAAQTDSIDFSVISAHNLFAFNRTSGVNYLGQFPTTEPSEIAVATFNWGFEWSDSESINETYPITFPQYSDGTTASPEDVITIVSLRSMSSGDDGNHFNLRMQLNPGGDLLQFSGEVVITSPEEEGIYPQFDFCTIAFRPSEVPVADRTMSQVKSLFKALGGQ